MKVDNIKKKKKRFDYFAIVSNFNLLFNFYRISKEKSTVQSCVPDRTASAPETRFFIYFFAHVPLVAQ